MVGGGEEVERGTGSGGSEMYKTQRERKKDRDVCSHTGFQILNIPLEDNNI